MEKNGKSQNCTFPIFHAPVRTLLEMATSKFAYVCWCSKIINKPDSDSCWGLDAWYKECAFSCTDILPMPIVIRPLIDDKISLIGKELQIWTVHNYFGTVIPREVVVNCVVFDSEDNICYKKTAKNLLKTNPAFGLIEQFEIACKYNIEEDIERLWPLVKDVPSLEVFRLKLSAPYIRTIDYWCSRMRGELNNVYGYRSRTPEYYVLQRQTCYRSMMDWGEIEYFWNKLNITEQTYFVEEERWMENFIDHLIWNMSDVMLENAAKSVPNLILKYFAADELYYEYTLQIWDHIKDFLIDHKRLFYRILIDLSEMAFYRPYDYGYGHVATLLKDMWLNAPDELKIYICYHCQFRGILDIVEGERLLASIMQFADIRSFGCDIGFVIELSRNTSFETRQRIWFRWWWKFVVLAKIPDLLELITICFDSVNDMIAFKKEVMLEPAELQEVVEEFVGQGLDDALDEYLKFCCSDDDDEKHVSGIREKIRLKNKEQIVPKS